MIIFADDKIILHSKDANGKPVIEFVQLADASPALKKAHAAAILLDTDIKTGHANRLANRGKEMRDRVAALRAKKVL